MATRHETAAPALRVRFPIFSTHFSDGGPSEFVKWA